MNGYLMREGILHIITFYMSHSKHVLVHVLLNYFTGLGISRDV